MCNKPSPVRFVWCICCNSLQQRQTRSTFGQCECISASCTFSPSLDNFNPSYDTKQEQTDHLKNGEQFGCLGLITAHSGAVIQDRIPSSRAAMSYWQQRLQHVHMSGTLFTRAATCWKQHRCPVLFSKINTFRSMHLETRGEPHKTDNYVVAMPRH